MTLGCRSKEFGQKTALIDQLFMFLPIHYIILHYILYIHYYRALSRLFICPCPKSHALYLAPDGMAIVGSHCFWDTHHLLPAALPLIDPFPYLAPLMDAGRAGPRLHHPPGRHVRFLLSSGAAGKPLFIATSPKPSETRGKLAARLSTLLTRSNLMLSLMSRRINGIIFLIR